MFVLVTIGAIIAYIVCITTSLTEIQFLPGSINLTGALATFLAAFFVGGVFSVNRQRIEAAKMIDTVKAMGASIAHEIRTPLGTIKFYTEAVQQYMVDLISVYTIAKEQGIDVPLIPKRQFALLENSLEQVIAEVDRAANIIDMLLTNVNYMNISEKNFAVYSMKKVITIAMERYSFPEGTKELIHWQNQDQDFSFWGDEMYIVHVLFNLLKNALYFIQKKGSGEIYLWLETGKQYNKLYFKDTGLGINQQDIAHIFDKFYTKNTHQGSGIGLAFCKMVMLAHKGDIVCFSEEGKYTEFVLSFPAYTS